MLASPENTRRLSAIRNKRPLVIVVGLGALLLTACGSSNEETLSQQSAVAGASSSANPGQSTSSEPTPSSTIQNDPISDVLRNYDPDSKFPYSYAEAKETLQTSGIGDFLAITNAIDAQDLAYFTKQKLSVKQLETNLDMYNQLLESATAIKTDDETAKLVIEQTITTYQAMRLLIKEALSKEAITSQIPQEPIPLTWEEYTKQGKTDIFMYTLSRPTRSEKLWNLFGEDEPTDEALFNFVALQPSPPDPGLALLLKQSAYLTASCSAAQSGYKTGCDLEFFTARF